MIQIPTSRDVARSNTRSGRIAPSGPTVSVGEGIAQFGNALQQVAYDLNDLRTQEAADNQNKAGFDLETNIARFRDEEEQAFLKAREDASESGIGFTRQFIEGYQKRANDFGEANFNGLNDGQKERAKQSIMGLGNSLYGKAYDYEQKSKSVYYDRTTNQGLDGVRTQIKNNSAPYEELKRQGLASIDAADMPEAWKAERRAQWDADAAESKWQWKFGQDPDTAVRQMKGITVDAKSLSGAINQTAQQLGIDPVDLATVMSYETGGTFDPWVKGPTTKWGTHRGLIQWGEPQRAKYGVTEDMPIEQQVAAAGRYLKDAGVKPGMGLLDIYSAINAGAPGLYDRSDYKMGGAPGTVADKVKYQMEGHKAKAAALLGGTYVPKPGDPDIENIPYDRRQQLAAWGEGQYRKQVAEEAANTRAQIEIASANAPVAIQNTGGYSGALPTSEQFIQAYGPQDGASRYNQFLASVQTSQQAYQMQTMPETEINQLLGASKPTASGDTAVLDAARYDTLSKAASQVIKAREADPAAYVQQVFPSVANAWQDAQSSGDYRTALATSAAAQQQLGIQDMRLLPKQMADQAVSKFNDQNASGQDRIGAVTGMVFATSDPEQRRAIFEQMVSAGLPDATEGAIDAYARGDEGAGRRLMEAAIVDPSKLPGTTNLKPSDIDAEIQAKIMDDGQIGDIFYGLSDGTVENQERAIRDSKLLTNAVSIRVRNGETLEAAVDGAAKDLYGDIKPITGNMDVNAQILVPKDADERTVLEGLSSLLPTVRKNLESGMAVPADIATKAGEKAITEAVRENYIENVMAEGYFRNSGDGYVFIDPYVGAAVAGPDGQPVVFSDSDMRAMPRPVKPSPDFEAMPQTRIQTPKEVQESEYGKFAPMLDNLGGEAPQQDQQGGFNPGPIGGSGGY